ncbi:hypothetical protein IT575_11365 [bacterium]|nr:hypothetical protein [bacterium]
MTGWTGLLRGGLALGAALLLGGLSACGGGGSGAPRLPAPDVHGIWTWDLVYRDGSRLQFSMLLTVSSEDRYTVKVEDEDRGTARMIGNTFRWTWEKPDSTTFAEGVLTAMDLSDEIRGSGNERYHDGSPRRTFSFVATRSPAPNDEL